MVDRGRIATISTALNSATERPREGLSEGREAAICDEGHEAFCIVSDSRFAVSLLRLSSTETYRDAGWRNAVWKSFARALLVSLGMLLIAVGVVGSLLPGHLGAPVLVVGLIVVLRNSPPSRRRFIDLQRRHPKVLYPIRRLLRREPEILPVAWQQVLRLERLLLPPPWRIAGKTRRRLMRGRRVG